MDKRGFQLRDRDIRWKLVEPQVKEILDEIQHPDFITVDFLLAIGFVQTDLNPLYKYRYGNRHKQYGFYGMCAKDWKFIWTEIIKQDIPNAYDFRANIVACIHYLIFLWDEYGDIDKLLMAWKNLKLMRLFRDSGVNLKRESSVFLAVGKYHQEYGEHISTSLLNEILTFPASVRNNIKVSETMRQKCEFLNSDWLKKTKDV